jgi:hypothetical protein
MKTRKQVLAEFQRMHRQLCGKVRGFVVVQEYNGDDFAYWCIKMQVTKFNDKEIEARNEVEWTHYSRQSEEQERENEAVLAEFKEKFNLK